MAEPNSANPDTIQARPEEPGIRLSFVIPAHDEESLIAGTIDAIHDAVASLHLPYEVIVAADGCTDATATIAAEHGATVVSHDRRQIAATRNLGARTATGDLLVFVDADTRINRQTIEEVVAFVKKGAVAGGAPFRFDGPLPWHFRVVLPTLLGLFRLVNLTGGAFLYCTRTAFDAVGGWDERLYAGEEIYFAMRLKRHGRFRLTRHPVITSGRKVRTHSLVEVLSLFLRGSLMPWTLLNRKKLGFFYGPRRKDPMIK